MVYTRYQYTGILFLFLEECFYIPAEIDWFVFRRFGVKFLYQNWRTERPPKSTDIPLGFFLEPNALRNQQTFRWFFSRFFHEPNGGK